MRLKWFSMCWMIVVNVSLFLPLSRSLFFTSSSFPPHPLCLFLPSAITFSFSISLLNDRQREQKIVDSWTLSLSHTSLHSQLVRIHLVGMCSKLYNSRSYHRNNFTEQVPPEVIKKCVKCQQSSQYIKHCQWGQILIT